MVHREIRQYAVYMGEPRSYPQGEEIIPKALYQIHVIKPAKERRMWIVDVQTEEWSLYVPYSSFEDIYRDWMPFDGLRHECTP